VSVQTLGRTPEGVAPTRRAAIQLGFGVDHRFFGSVIMAVFAQTD